MAVEKWPLDSMLIDYLWLLRGSSHRVAGLGCTRQGLRNPWEKFRR